jgi:hypothetical protein
MKGGTKAKKYAAGGAVASSKGVKELAGMARSGPTAAKARGIANAERMDRDASIMNTERARREEAKQRKMVADARREEKEMRANEEAYNRSLTSPEMVSPKKDKPAKKAMGGMMNSYAAGGMVKARGMGAATRGGKCKMS